MSEEFPSVTQELDARTSQLAELELRLGYQFSDLQLLERALQHSSFAHEIEGMESNERLEFLGDAVLGVVVAHSLFDAHPDWAEGDLSRALASLVDRRSLARVGTELRLGECLRFGRTEQRSGGAEKASILADATEAVLGAMYLDDGLEPIRRFVKVVFASSLAPGAPRVERDPKTELNEKVMAESGEFPIYEVVVDSEIENDAQRFTVHVRILGEVVGEGCGRTKRLAEVAAARAALLEVPSDG